MKQNSRSKRPLAGQSPNGHDRVPVKVRDGSTVSAVAPSRKAIGASHLNGDTPYFRFYADSWRARLAGLSSEAQALVLQAAAIGWSESLHKPLKMTMVRWAQACGCTVDRLTSALAEFSDLEWIELSPSEGSLSVFIPDLSSQAEIVTYERDKKRRQRAKAKEEGQSPGRIDRGRELIKSERQAAHRSAGHVRPASVASEEDRHAILRPVLASIGATKASASKS